MVVTGASRGIGAKIALRLARDRFSVVVNYAGNALKTQETVQQIEILGGTALVGQADVARLFQTTFDRFGRIDTVVNNAAAVSFLLGPDGEWVNAQVLRVNGGFA